MSDLENTLREIAGRYAPVALASSLQAEDMVITDAIARLRLPIGVFRVKVVAVNTKHRTTISIRTYRGCKKSQPVTHVHRHQHGHH